MKEVLLIIITFLYLSCSYNYDRDIKKIEKILEINLKEYNHEIKDVEYSFGFGEESVIFYIMFNEQSFKSFLNEIDLNKFNSNKLGVFDYSLTVEDEDCRISLFIDIDKKTLKYTYKG